MMKKYILRRLSLLLALVLLLGAVPFASADCSHSSVTTSYTATDDGGAHEKFAGCDSCGQTVFNGLEFCIDMDRNGECDKCFAMMLSTPLCYHSGTSKSYTDNGMGTHTTKVVCTACDAVLTEETEDCVDTNASALCDYCGAEMAVASGVTMACAQSGTTVTGDTAELVFTLDGVPTDAVDWTFEASGSAAPILENDTATGAEGTVTVVADNGRGVATVVAVATWAGGQARGAAVVSFCERVSHTVEIKDDVKSFRFGQGGYMKAADTIPTSVLSKYSLYTLMTDGCGTYVKLTESSKENERVATITCRTTDKSKQYDPDGDNIYSTSSLNALTFTILEEGTYKLNFEIQEKVGNYMLPTTRGTIAIVVGTPKDEDVNLIYYTDANEPVSFGVNDFVRFWEDNRQSKYEDLRYVTFEFDGPTTGLLHLDSSIRGTVNSEYKFFVNLLNEQPNVPGYYKLDGVTYRPDPREKSYTEEITFTAYGRSNGVLRGVITVVVGAEMRFVDVIATDWYHEEVSFVYSKGIMEGVSTTEFKPNDTLTRGMVVTMLHRAAGKPAVTAKASFTDVEDGQWYTEAVAWAAENGLVLGKGDGTFAPGENITREQLVTILHRYAGFANMDTNTGTASLKTFGDHHSVSTYAAVPMTWAINKQLLTENNNLLRPTADATRAEAAVAFGRFLK